MLLRGRERLVGRRHLRRVGERHAARLQQRPRRHVARLGHRGRGCRPVGRHPHVGSREPVRGGERPAGRADAPERRHAAVAQRPPRWLVDPLHGRHQRVPGGGHGGGRLGLVQPAGLLVRHRAEAADQDRGVELAALQQQVEHARVRVHVVEHGRQVDRVPCRCRARPHLAHPLLEAVGELGHDEAAGRQHARCDHRDAAAVRQDADPRAARPRGHQQALRGLHQLLRRRHQERAGVAECGRHHALRRDQRAGVRLRGPGGRLARGRQHDHRLAEGPRLGDGAQEPATVAEVLAVDADRAHLGVVREIGDDVADGDVGLVADRDEVRHPEAHLDAVRREVDAQPARLGDERERPRHLAVVEPGRVEPLVSSPHSHAVRPQQDGALLAHPAGDALLDRTALGPRLGESDRDADERPHAPRKAVLDHLLEGVRRHHQQRQVDGLVQVAQRRHRRQPLHGRAAGVDELHPAAIGAAQHAAGDAEPPLGRVVGRTDDRDRARVQQRREVAAHLNSERAMISRWMSDVPSYSSSSLAARSHRSTGYSRE